MRTLCFLILLLSGTPFFIKATTPVVIKGELYLKDSDISKEAMIKLNGEWEFFEGQLIKTYPQKILSDPILLKVPGSWNNYVGNKKGVDGYGYGSYRLHLRIESSAFFTLMIQDVASSYKIWINNELRNATGITDTLATLVKPIYEKSTIILRSDTNFYEIVIEVANFNQHKGGIKNYVSLIKTDQINLQHERESLMNYFCLGIIFIMGLYHIVLYLLNNKDLPALNFGLFSFDIFIFLVFRTRTIYYFFKDFDWNLGNKIEYIALYLSLPLFYIFFYRSFPRQYKRISKIVSISISLALILLILFTDTGTFSYTLDFYHIILLAYIIIVINGLRKALRKNEEGGKIIFAGFLIFMAALVNDILHVQNIINTDNYIIFGIVGFIICQGLFLAFKSARDHRKIIKLSLNLNELNQSLSRFVPTDFVRLLNKKNIIEVSLGNNAEREMTIMFSDIRSFTTISESLSPAGAFGFINDYLQKMAPVITKHGGFIDKYMGDGIMAIFPDNASDAVLAARSMMMALDAFNAENIHHGKPSIEIGIGLHTGICILGTVGEPLRMDTTVIADAVNLAARIESLTKFYKTAVIISEETYKKLDPSISIYIRFIGEVKVKGKSISTKLYKVFLNHQYELELLEDFDKAILYFYEQKFLEASVIFEKLKHSNLYDGVLQHYINHSLSFSINPPLNEWKNFEVFNY